MTCGPAEHVAWEKEIRFRGCGAGGSPRNRVEGGWPSRRRRLAQALASDATGTAVANDRAVTPLGDRPVVPEATGPAVADDMMGDASHPSSLRECFRGCSRPDVSEATGPAVADDMTAMTPALIASSMGVIIDTYRIVDACFQTRVRRACPDVG